MEAPKPIMTKQDENSNSDNNINFIEALLIKSENNEYYLQFGISELYNQSQMAIKVKYNNINNYFFFQNIYNLNDFKNLSKIFFMYENIKEIISFLKTLKFEILEKNENMIVKFNIFLSNG